MNNEFFVFRDVSTNKRIVARKNSVECAVEESKGIIKIVWITKGDCEPLMNKTDTYDFEGFCTNVLDMYDDEVSVDPDCRSE